MLLSITAGAEELSIRLETDPTAALLRPFGEAPRFTIAVSDSAGNSLQRGEISLVLEAPPASGFLSTDFPLIEGTRLLQIQLPLNDGRAEWRQVLPIRGVYRLSVDARSSDGRVGKHNFELSVWESREKWLWLGLFCAALFLVGFVAGRIFTQSHGAKALLLIVPALTCALIAAAHEAARAAQGEMPTAALEIEPATVGKLTRVRWHGISPGSRLQSLAIVHLEKHKTVLALEKLSVEKEFTFSFHFPDGAQYVIQATAETSVGGQDRAEQKVSVIGIEPRFGMQLPSLILFLSVIALGLGAGRFSKRS